MKMAVGQVNEKLLKRTRTEFVDLVKRKKGELTTEFQVWYKATCSSLYPQMYSRWAVAIYVHV